MASVETVNAKIDAHVDICAVRYEGIERETKGIHARIKRLEQIVLSGSGAIIVMLATIIIKGL